MDLPEPDETEIPKFFYPEASDEPFRNCVDCDCDLLTGVVPYSIQKVMVLNESVFEFAMCHNCMERMRTELSEETQIAYQTFLYESGPQRLEELRNSTEGIVIEEWIQSCMVCEKQQDDCHRFTMFGMAIGERLPFAMMVCDECEKKLGELTSKETRDRWDRFVEENFDSPPGIEIDSPFGQPILL